jgi:hypothetical protein
MREMVDSKDLHKMAAFFLFFVTAVTPPIEIVKPLIESLLKTLRESPVSPFHPFRKHHFCMLNQSLISLVLEDSTARVANLEYHLLPRTSLG